MMNRGGPGMSANTGPKGVMADYREACRKAREERVQKEVARIRALEKLAVGDPVEYTAAQQNLPKLPTNKHKV